MIHRIEFFKDGKLVHSRSWELGLDAARQHVTLMTERYGATHAFVLDTRGREVFTFAVPKAD